MATFYCQGNAGNVSKVEILSFSLLICVLSQFCFFFFSLLDILFTLIDFMFPTISIHMTEMIRNLYILDSYLMKLTNLLSVSLFAVK